jgi:TatD DNase family protein
METYFLHDSHSHLELLLERIGVLPEKFLENVNFDNFNEMLEKINLDEVSLFISNILARHDLAIHATVDNINYYLARSLIKNNKVKFLLGSHPEIVKSDFDVYSYLVEQQNVMAKFNDFIGIGEIGLDYYYSQDEIVHKLQQSLMKEQIILANQLGKPIVFHVREAFDDFFRIIDEARLDKPFIVHCFTGTLSDAGNIIKRGGYLGIGGILTFRKSQWLREVVEKIDLDKIVLETDLPFLSPEPYRGKICLPEYVDFIGQKIAEIKNVSNFEIFTKSKSNVQKIFGL